MDDCIFVKRTDKKTNKTGILKITADQITSIIPSEHLRGFQGKIKKMGYMVVRRLNQLNPSYEFSLIEK